MNLAGPPFRVASMTSLELRQSHPSISEVLANEMKAS